MSDVFTGKDTIIIDGRLIEDLANGKVAEARYPNKISNSSIDKNGNSINVYVADGESCEVTLRVLIGSKTDQYLTLRKSQWKKDPASFVALTGKFTKRVGNGKGKTKKVELNLEGGVFAKNIETEEDTTGDLEQTVAIYLFSFTRTTRTIK